MRIARLTAYVVSLALRREIAHASATRRTSANIVVACELGDGTRGWGEGVPRPYVTGETPDTALAQLVATPLREQLAGDHCSWHDVTAVCRRFAPRVEGEDPRGCRANALRCAVELSILDAYGRLFGEPLAAITARYPPAAAIHAARPVVRYSGAIMAESPRSELTSALKMRLYGFAHCKVKVGVAGADDSARLARIRRVLGRRIDIRVDANEAWPAAEAVARIAPLLAHRISCVEQPLPHAEIDALADVRRQLTVPIMLDESLTGPSDARRAIDGGLCDLFNIRLSKCGGFLASLELAALAHSHALGYQLGCHPGESGILSAAGRHWAQSVAAIRYLEGSYDRHLLRDWLLGEDITFGYGGRAPALRGPGLGVSVAEAAVKRLAVSEQSFPIG